MAVQRIAIRDINKHIVCALCYGYYIDPVTITECLHSFCKTCLFKYVEKEKYCPVCETPIHKTKPLFNIRADKTLQDIVYKLVPGLHKDEMLRRQNFFHSYPPKDEHFSCFKQEKEKIFFSENDEFSISIQYFESNDVTGDQRTGVGKCRENRNKRYLECPGMLKMKHLKKFIIKKYGLNGEEFLVEMIYKDEIIPEEYSVIDVAYLHNYRKDRPMQFFYRIFRKNKVLLRKRKLPTMSSQGKIGSRKPSPSSLSAAPPTISSSSYNACTRHDVELSATTGGNSAKRIKTDECGGSNSTEGRGCAVGGAAISTTDKCHREHQASIMSATVAARSHTGQNHPQLQRQDPKSSKNVNFPESKQTFAGNGQRRASAGTAIAPTPLQPALPPSQQQTARRHETINVTAKDVKQIIEELKEKTVAAAAAAAENDDRYIKGNAVTSSHQRIRHQGSSLLSQPPLPPTTVAPANFEASKISQEQKMAIRNFRLGGGQQVQPPPASTATALGDSEKILSIVSNLAKKQAAKQQQQQQHLANSSNVAGGVHSGLSRKTTIQKTTVGSIQLGSTERESLSASSDPLPTRVKKPVHQPDSDVSAMERHLAKTLPSGTAVTVKMAAGLTNNDKPYNNRDGIITPILKKDVISGGPRTDSVKKSLSDRSFINVSEALMKQKTVMSSTSASGVNKQQQGPRPTMTGMFKTAIAGSVAKANNATVSVVASPAIGVGNAILAASPPSAMRVVSMTTLPPPTTTAAFPNLAAANSTSAQLTAMTAVAVENLGASSTSDSMAIRPQIPKNRLDVKFQHSSSPHHAVTDTAVKVSGGVLTQSQQQIISFQKQPQVTELLWSGAAAPVNPVNKDPCIGSVVAPRKTLNQGIRQIPNPSLLTNKHKSGSGDVTQTATD